jgi:hypothetical protein
MSRRWILFAVATLNAGLLLADTPQTEIRVEVKDKQGKPVERAAVIMDFVSSHRQVFKLGKRAPKHWELRTNMGGVARFPAIPQGTIRVQVIAKNYQTFGNKFDVDEPQKIIQVTLEPPQKQYSIYGPSADSSEKQNPQDKPDAQPKPDHP